MHAHLHRIDTHTLECRVGPEAVEYGRPYDVCVNVLGNPPACRVSGLDKPITLSQRRAIRDCLIAAGYERAAWERRSSGCVRTVTKVKR